jgi:hypothetical protein
MSLWGFLTICGVVAIICGAYETRLKTMRMTRAESKRIDDVGGRLDRLETRMANLETIILRAEDKREFEQL